MDKYSLVHPGNISYLEPELESVNNRFKEYSKRTPTQSVSSPSDEAHNNKQQSVLSLINAYRFTGHLFADLDPLKRTKRQITSFDLTLESYGLSEADLDTEFFTGSLFGVDKTTLKNIINTLKKTYTSTIGFDYMHIVNMREKRFLQERIETNYPSYQLSNEKKKWILEQLTQAEAFEQFLHNKDLGQKRFSLERAVTTIPLLNHLIHYASNAYNIGTFLMFICFAWGAYILFHQFKNIDKRF